MKYYRPSDGPLTKAGRGCLLAVGSALLAAVLMSAVHSLTGWP